MNEKERMLAAWEGRPIDRPPVVSPYQRLYFKDHFAELSGQPQWRMQAWLHADPDEHIETYAKLMEKAPFEAVDAFTFCAPRKARDRIQFMEKDGKPYRVDRKTGEQTLIEECVSGHATDYTHNKKRTVFTREDIPKVVPIQKANELLESGQCDYAMAAARRWADERFIYIGSVVSPFYMCTHHLGFEDLFASIITEPDLVEHLMDRLLQFRLEHIRAMAECGGDAIWIDDAAATSDMISVEQYRRFSKPRVTALVEEIHRLGLKAMVIYFGGVMDRLEDIAETGADAITMEASMKGFTNDIAEAAKRIGDRMTIYGNINPGTVLQDGTNTDVEAEIETQIRAGKKARGFVLSTGSPVTPSTPADRIRMFIESGRKIGGKIYSEKADD